MSNFLKFSRIKSAVFFSTMTCLAGANEAYCYSIEEAARLVFPEIQGKTFSEMKADDFGQTRRGVNLKDSFRNFNALCYIAAAETSGYHYIICDKEYIPTELKKCYELLSGSREPAGLKSSSLEIKEWDGYTTYNRMVFSPDEADKLVNNPAVMNTLMLLENMLGERSEMYSIFHFKEYREKKKDSYSEHDFKFYTEKWKSAEIIKKYQDHLPEKLKNSQLIKNSIFIGNDNDFAKIKTKNPSQLNNYSVAIIGNEVTKISDYAFRSGYHDKMVHITISNGKWNISYTETGNGVKQTGDGIIDIGSGQTIKTPSREEINKNWMHMYNFSKILMGEGTKLKEIKEDSFLCDSDLKEVVIPIPTENGTETNQKNFYPNIKVPSSGLVVNKRISCVRWIGSFWNRSIEFDDIDNIFYPVFPDLEDFKKCMKSEIEGAILLKNRFHIFLCWLDIANDFLQSWIKEKITSQSEKVSFKECSFPKICNILDKYDNIAGVSAFVNELESQLWN